MDDYRYIPIEGDGVKTYIFQVSLQEEEDGRWSAWIDTLPGCSAWANNKEEALEALTETAQAYIEVLLEKGQTIPLQKGVEIRDVPIVSVTI